MSDSDLEIRSDEEHFEPGPGLLVQQIADNITSIVPGVVNAEILAQHLVQKGMNDMALANQVQMDDVKDHLPPLQARALLAVWNPNASAAPTAAHQSRRQQPQVVESREWQFNIHWEDIYNIDKDMKKTLQKGRKLNIKQSKALVKRLVNQVRNKVPHALRCIFRQVAGDLKTKYGATFKGELVNGKITAGSLTKRMQDVFDTEKRPKERTSVEVEAPATKAAYGCKRWRSKALPKGETPTTQEKKRSELQKTYCNIRPRAWDWAKIEEKMSETYATQRSDLNRQAEDIEKAQKDANRKKRRKRQVDESNRAEEEEVDEPAIPILKTIQIRDRWPFLFTSRGMSAHFKILTDYDIHEKIRDFISNEGKMETMVNFLKTCSVNSSQSKHLKRALKRPQNEKVNAKFAGLLSMVANYVNEDIKGLIILVDEGTKERDVEKMELPKTPRLIATGASINKAKCFYFTMDTKLLGEAGNLQEAIGMLYASYFVFNVLYEATAQITLEFIQRIIAECNPPRGNKRPPKAAGGKSSTTQIHQTLQSLCNKYEYWLADQMESTDGESD